MGPETIQGKAHPSLYSLELFLRSVWFITAECDNRNSAAACTENGNEYHKRCCSSSALPKIFYHAGATPLVLIFFPGGMCSIAPKK